MEEVNTREDIFAVCFILFILFPSKIKKASSGILWLSGECASAQVTLEVMEQSGIVREG